MLRERLAQQLERTLAILQVVHVGHRHDFIRLMQLGQLHNAFLHLRGRAGGTAVLPAGNEGLFLGSQRIVQGFLWRHRLAVGLAGEETEQVEVVGQLQGVRLFLRIGAKHAEGENRIGLGLRRTRLKMGFVPITRGNCCKRLRKCFIWPFILYLLLKKQYLTDVNVVIIFFVTTQPIRALKNQNVQPSV